MSEAIRIVLVAFAIYRAALLLTKETGPFDVFMQARINAGTRALNSRFWLTISQLFSCPFCIGVWLAAMGAVAIYRPTVAGDVVVLCFGLAGGQAFLQSMAERQNANSHATNQDGF